MSIRASSSNIAVNTVHGSSHYFERKHFLKDIIYVDRYNLHIKSLEQNVLIEF